MQTWKFCKTGDSWWLCISDLAQFLEYKDKTSSVYGFALVKGATGEAMTEREKKYGEVAKLYAETHKVSMLDGMTHLSSTMFNQQLDYIMSGKELWFNERGGYNFGLTSEKVIYRDKPVFPNYTKDDIKVTQWGGAAKGSHYYASVGDIEVKVGTGNDTIMKWATFQEAYDEALKYISSESEED